MTYAYLERRGCCQGRHIHAGLAANGGDTRMGLQQVDRGVALEVQHGVVAAGWDQAGMSQAHVASLLYQQGRGLKA